LMHQDHPHPLCFLARRWPPGWVLISAFIYHGQPAPRGWKTGPICRPKARQRNTASAASAVGNNEGRCLRAA
jgi:hypothetical protein